MTTRRRLLATSAALPACIGGMPMPVWAQSRQRRAALVIGNAQYAEALLANPENDARLVGGTLRTLGFDVELQFNLKTREFKRVLRDFSRMIDDDELALVLYYAGHGMQIERRNYLLPTDLNLRDEDEVRDEAIDIEEALLSRIDKVRPRARIFIIDACRDNPFSTRTRGARSAGGLAEMAAPGALIAFSAAPGRTAEDGPPGGNSVYTRILAQEMLAEGVEVEEMMKAVRVKVLRETRERQLPFLNTSMVTNFYFNPRGQTLAPAAAAAAAPLTGRRVLRLALQADRSLNTDRLQASAALALRLYVLRDDKAFQRAGFDQLYDSDEATLGPALLHVERLHLRPGETREVEFALPRDARLVAVFAAYREIDRAQWRSVLEIPTGAPVPPLRLTAQARQVELAWSR